MCAGPPPEDERPSLHYEFELPRFLERAESTRLGELLRARTPSIGIAGPRGSGKTWLIRWAVERAKGEQEKDEWGRAEEARKKARAEAREKREEAGEKAKEARKKAEEAREKAEEARKKAEEAEGVGTWFRCPTKYDEREFTMALFERF